VPLHSHCHCLTTISFYAFKFCLGEEGSICSGVALDYVLRGRLGESCAVNVAHLLGLQVMQGALKSDNEES
jgi:hypothetical protein